MDHAGFRGYVCWKDERISQVINKEAISVDLANFMATHTPLHAIRFLKSPYQISMTSEEGLLTELTSSATKDQHAFVVIQGIPGTGKSHLIRWLRERYSAEMGESGKEIVILIERAQNSLLGTLQQIIQSGALDEQALSSQLAKLRSATETLSNAALGDALLDHLRVATYEMKLDEAEKPKVRIRKNIEYFLLDPLVREQLKARPVQRIVDFLTAGSSAAGAQGMPEFEPDDFEFSIAFLENLKRQGGYEETRRLADGLREEDMRIELARHLNRLLTYAIGHTTALTADELQQIFYDLRRQLRQQGRNLTLFIEDITSFTGVDTGLIDVLATQHTGERNREFCRITSVIGITDSYFKDRFPDNMRERVTHLLTLNSQDQGRAESELLQSEEMTAHLSARYLNAMRVSHAELEAWVRSGSRPDTIPNACPRCPFREPCHLAFGAINVVEGGDIETQVGLYPFNKNAVWTMYERLNPTQVTRTPRTLLSSILLYVLQSHGGKVARLQFPPPPRELGSDFTTPTLRQPTHQRTINDQSGADARRVESLLLFWGDTSAYSQGQGAERTVGGLTETVFHAFGAPFIAGEATQQISPPPRIVTPAPTGTDKTPISPTTPTPGLQPGGGTGGDTSGQDVATAQTPIPAKVSKHVSDISNWLSGQKLHYYEDLRKWLFGFIESAIDWESYGISDTQRGERLRAGRFGIEDQSGGVRKDSLVFKRSPELSYALQALAALNDGGRNVDDTTIGAHLVNLSTWLQREEARIVEFIRQPSVDISEPVPLLKILLINTLFVDCLRGRLAVTHESARDIFLALINNSKLDQTKPPTKSDWQGLLERSEQIHTKSWVGLLKRIGHERAVQIHTDLLRQLNRPQGSSSNILFVDAASALDILRDFTRQDWAISALPSLTDIASTDKVWVEGVHIYTAIEEFLDLVLNDEQVLLQEILTKIEVFLGGDSASVAVTSIRKLLAFLRGQQTPYEEFLDNLPGSVPALENAMQFLQTTVRELSRRELVIRLSAITTFTKTMLDFTIYFQRFAAKFQRQEAQLVQKIAEASADEGAQFQEATRLQYAAVLEQLQDMLAEQPQSQGGPA